MTNSRTGARKVQNEPGRPCTRKQEKSQEYFVKGCVKKRHRNQPAGALPGQNWGQSGHQNTEQ